MKKKSQNLYHPVVDNVRKLMIDRGLTQEAMAEIIKTTASQFSKILSGKSRLSLAHMSNIATALKIRIIDIFTYPEIYEPVNTTRKASDVKAILQIELKKDKKDKMLKLVFGDGCLEILNNNDNTANVERQENDK